MVRSQRHTRQPGGVEEPGDIGSPYAPSAAARTGGMLLTIGGALALALVATVPTFVHGKALPTSILAGVACAIGLFCMLFARRVPAWFIPLIGPLGIVLIATSSVLTGTTSDGSELLYLWPVLFSAYFLSLRAALFNVILVALIYPAIAISILGGSGITPSVYMVGTSIVTLVVTTSLRRQVNRTVASAALEARTDKLTDLPNRRSWDDGLSGVVASQVAVNAPLCMMMIDLDRFKQLNDTQGHAAGDSALALVAGVLRAQTRQTDLLARVGGEEFAVALRDCALTDGLRRAEQIRVAVEKMSASWPMPLTVSIGVAALNVEAPSTCAELMANADAALYAAKRSGRNTVRTLSEPSESLH